MDTHLVLTNNPNITSPVVGIHNRIRVAQLACRVLNIAGCHRSTIEVQPPNFIPSVAGIVVDVVHAVDAVEVVVAWAGVADDMPFRPRTVADGTDSGARFGSEEVANHARVSNVEVCILTRGRGIKIGRSCLNERQLMERTWRMFQPV